MKRTLFAAGAATTILAAAFFVVPSGSADASGSADSPTKSKAAVTFNKDVAPILFKNCAECHRPGEPAGSKIMLQVHYSKTAGQVEKDRSMIGLVFAKQPPKKELINRLISNNYFEIPPCASANPPTTRWLSALLCTRWIANHLNQPRRALEEQRKSSQPQREAQWTTSQLNIGTE
jgi:hypothetical protein